MLARPAPGGVLPAAVAQWKKFLELARRQRLEADVFESHVSILSSKFRLPPMFIAELVLAPPRPDSYMLDNRIPQYLDVLLKLRLLDTPSVLRVLYKYSTLHKHAPPTAAAPASNSTESDKAKAGANGHTGKSQGENARRRWGGSYSSDELVFFRLHRFISKGPGIRSGREAVDVVRIVARWMTLFADVAAAFSRDAFGGLVSLQTKNEVDLTRQAFSLLVVAMCENQLVVNTLRKPGAKGKDSAFKERGVLRLTGCCSGAKRAFKEFGELHSVDDADGAAGYCGVSRTVQIDDAGEYRAG